MISCNNCSSHNCTLFISACISAFIQILLFDVSKFFELTWVLKLYWFLTFYALVCWFFCLTWYRFLAIHSLGFGFESAFAGQWFLWAYYSYWGILINLLWSLKRGSLFTWPLRHELSLEEFRKLINKNIKSF